MVVNLFSTAIESYPFGKSRHSIQNLFKNLKLKKSTSNNILFSIDIFLSGVELNSKNFLLMFSRAKMSLGREIHDTVMTIYKNRHNFFKDIFMSCV